VAKGDFVESTLACSNIEIAQQLAPIFRNNQFEIQISDDVLSAEICGALKNVVAMGAGEY